jgi:hypothetical protein
MNDAATRRQRLAEPEGLRAMNAEELYRQTYADLARANRRIARLLHTMHAVEIALDARPESDPVDRSLAQMLRDSRNAGEP